MSVIPPLIIWSSIKIPHPGECHWKRNKTDWSVPYVHSSEKIKKRGSAEITQKLVSLRVPSPLRIEKGNSAPDATHPSQYDNIKGSDCDRPKRIKCLHVPAPEFPDFDAAQNQDLLRCNCSDHNSSPCCQVTFFEDLDQNLNSEKFPDSGSGMDFDSIPSVKPCTAEELRMLKVNHPKEKKSRKLKHKTNKIKATQSDLTTPRPKSTILDCSKSGKCLTQKFNHTGDAETSVSYCSGSPSRKEYYEGKLAELYLIELGMN